MATPSGDEIRALTPITADGHTRVKVKLESFSPSREMAGVLDAIRAGEESRGVCHLPLPQLDLFEGKAGSVGAEWTVGGRWSERVTFHVRDRVHVTLDYRQKLVSVQFKAKGMWAAGGGAQGYATMARKWVPAIHWMMTGETISLETSQSKGWRMYGLELCTDFVGLDFNTNDLKNFMSVRNKTERKTRSRKESAEYLAQHSKDGVTAQTIELGKRKGNQLSACIYKKLEEIQSKKQGDDSTYAPMWKKHQWDGKASITRVEFRFAGKGLHFFDNSTGEVLDFTDPMTATVYENLQTLWAVASYKRRLVVGLADARAKGENVSRLDSDGRWVKVQESCQLDLNLGADWKQEREVQEGAREFRYKKANREGVQATARAGNLSGVDVSTMDDATYAAFCVEERRQYALQGKDLREYRRTHRTGQCGFVEPEIAASRKPKLERVDATMAGLAARFRHFESQAA
jgi:hypothetical protein